MSKLYLMISDDVSEWDTESFVVVAKDEDDAILRHPDQNVHYDNRKHTWVYNVTNERYTNAYGYWTDDLSKINVEYIGEASDKFELGTVVSQSIYADY